MFALPILRLPFHPRPTTIASVVATLRSAVLSSPTGARLPESLAHPPLARLRALRVRSATSVECARRACIQRPPRERIDLCLLIIAAAVVFGSPLPLFANLGSCAVVDPVESSRERELRSSLRAKQVRSRRTAPVIHSILLRCQCYYHLLRGPP